MTDDRLRERIDEVAERWAPILTEHSDRVMWGIDAMHDWHYDEAILDVWIRFYRGLFGELPAADARRMAYGNANAIWMV